MLRIAAFLVAALVAVLGGSLAAGPAAAQIGSIFGDAPPRPPSNVPNTGFPPQPPPVQYPNQYPNPSAISAAPRCASAVRHRGAAIAAAAGRLARSGRAGRRRSQQPPVQRARVTPGFAAPQPAAGQSCARASPAIRRRHRATPRRRPTTPSSPKCRRKRSPTAVRCFPASTRSPAASSVSMRRSARPCNSARCRSPPGSATRARPPSRPTPTLSSRSMKSRCRARSSASLPAGCSPRAPACTPWSIRSTMSG